MTRKPTLSTTFIDLSSQLRRFVSRIVQPDDVEDIVQETFVKSYQADLKQDIKYTRSYMLKTAKHLALNHIAKWDNQHCDSLDTSDDYQQSLRSMQLEDEVTSKERFLLFCRATEQLSQPVRKCFILKKVYGMSQKEIAAQMKLSESTVEKHIAKGLLQSMRYMQQHEQLGEHSSATIEPARRVGK
ncbi:RNA polymerase sigma factor [Pseudoalteromonas sp. SR44-5]|jgi:RNA polymerase sigma-70 factor (ECF subfamily)|uniref:RNA polymerase sigma factor n=2 Tax=Pseudoalteromonas TaxID=53246 RepID=A0ABY3FIF9_9GAMM|nr:MULTISPECIES: RNA polymerase sigma factor [Pseudoalteromonas]MBB1291909.1 RNA polymerase sigma factor [Pseudoalteromonas sp. SR41-4]MBB1301338.1 RNA polymerase sigma factor [Pseudoalteromonas sp. SR44-8]MBB1308190.1 RNA polymerase sigma factor [Pseudoalteromonas sp. SR41-8]MBB1333230.1 RNA polymerase sigma factor [Pseudoalteromonas sp. SR41-6]MBB1342646.1 RNA polymerase sigma factor [Pseudoalteromonas sp. SR45-6]|tara:strand:- start:3834 stop:4391 length:558 start_codon:yes stop_codon:yes gene_type:complete